MHQGKGTAQGAAPEPPPQEDLASLAQRINEEHGACGRATRAVLEHAMQAGQLLLRAKARVPHGSWQDWIKANCTCSVRTAQLYMRLAHDLPALLEARGWKNETVAFLGLREALDLLTERPAVEVQRIDVPPAEVTFPPAHLVPVVVREVGPAQVERATTSKVLPPGAEGTRCAGRDQEEQEQEEDRRAAYRSYQQARAVLSTLLRYDARDVAAAMDPDEAHWAAIQVSTWMAYLAHLRAAIEERV